MDYQKLPNWQKIPQLKSLLDLSTPPKELFYIGNLDPVIFKNCVTVVGSRKMTDYGSRVVEKIIPSLVMQGKTIVSGFMYGVDQYAHKVTIENGGKTVAVLGWGIDTPLTGNDLRLTKEIIASGGLLLSEWQTQKPAHWTFPSRNRIVAALSAEVFVVEAAEKSGSLITAALALKLQRKLWAVPGPITSRASRGTNQLIASGKAQMWLDNFHPGGVHSATIRGEDGDSASSAGNDKILEILINEALSADELARKLDSSVAQVGAQLSMLAISGQIIERGGKFYVS